MAVKIRLSRFGKKNFAYFHIVVTDERSPRDSQYIEQIGTYDPNPTPAVIKIDAEKALAWLNKGAVPTNTARRILSYEGIMLRKHLEGGVAKGAFSQEEADKRWDAWKAERDAKVSNKTNSVREATKEGKKAAEEAEAKVNELRAEAIAKKKKEEEEKKAAEAAAAAKAAAEAAAQAAAEAAPEAAPAEAAEAPAEEAPKAEAPAEEAPKAE
jgi:small subunit ribosomal protein S16